MDVGEQRRAERALQESERHFRELFDEAPVAYHELDLANRITRVNATELNMLGYRLEEMVGRLVTDFIVQDEPDASLPAAAPADPRHESHERVFRRIVAVGRRIFERHRDAQATEWRNGWVLVDRVTLCLVDHKGEGDERPVRYPPASESRC